MNPQPEFEIHPGETILFRARPNRKWPLVAWKIFCGLLILPMAAFTLLAIGSRWATWLLTLAVALTSLLLLGYFVEDVARLFTGDCLLTDQRFWSKGYPYAWSRAKEIPVAEIESMTYRRDALFLRLKTSRKLQVYILADGKLLSQAFLQVSGKDRLRPQV
jgi:hypothetical protein